MPFVPVPKDLSKVKTKLVFNLTKRQLICFSIAVAIGVPAYIFTRSTLGGEGAVMLMIVLMLPFFLMGLYERDGLPAEIIAANYIRAHFLWPGKRPYKTENFYNIIELEGKIFAEQDKASSGTGTTPVNRRKAGKKKQK